MSVDSELKMLLESELGETLSGWLAPDSDLVERLKVSVNEIINYSIKISDKDKKVEMFHGEKSIGVICPGKIENESHGIFTNSHIYRKVEEGYRGKGLGKLLLYKYIEAGFPLPPYEYTLDYPTYCLLSKYGYHPDCAIKDHEETLLYGDEDIEGLMKEGFVIKLIREIA